MKLHPRYHIVNAAEIDFAEALAILTEKYDLTTGETVGLLSRYTTQVAKSLVQEERHPEHPDKKGDER